MINDLLVRQSTTGMGHMQTIIDCDADWGQGVLHTAKHVANQEPDCAPSDHMISSKI